MRNTADLLLDPGDGDEGVPRGAPGGRRRQGGPRPRRRLAPRRARRRRTHGPGPSRDDSAGHRVATLKSP